MKNVIINDHQRVYRELKDQSSWAYIDPMGLTVGAIETAYQQMTLDVTDKPKDRYIEQELHIEPSMVAFFYYFLHSQKRIPSQIEYIKFYYLLNKEWILKKIHPGDHHAAFFGRLSRFFPSMLRDIHFYHLLKESGRFEKVLFTLGCDLEAKVDVLVQSGGEWYGIQLRTQTRRSQYFYEKKKGRNPVPIRATLIDLPIDLREARALPTKKNDIKLYSKTHVAQLEAEIARHQQLVQV